MVRELRALAGVLVLMVCPVFSLTSAPSFKGAWNATTEYRGDYRNGVGDTVAYGTANGRSLYWWAKFYSKGDVPGQFAPKGGTSPWVLINSLSYTGSGSTGRYTWTGWNGGLDNALSVNQAAIPTWRDGAEGAYTIIHDDIGAIPFETGIKPGVDILKKYPDIKCGWGCYVGNVYESADPAAYWEIMRNMVLDGQEIVNHSYDHTSAAEQWAWADVDSLVPTTQLDPSIPRQIGGLKAIGFPQDLTPAGWDNAYTERTMENQLVTIRYTTNWNGSDPASNFGDRVLKGTQSITINPPVVTPKAGTTTITLPTGQSLYVKYTSVDTINGVNTGLVCATEVGWEDYDARGFTERNWTDKSFSADGGRSIWVAKFFCVNKWAPDDYRRQIGESKDSIDAEIYNRLAGQFGRYFRPNKELEYFVYPFDAYSEVTHDSIMARGYVAARGGAKSGKPLPGDFFHPNRIDFDAFYMVDDQASKQFPDNPHSILSLKGMVDSIVAKKGYMIRELHAVSDLPFESINNNEVGGWWGGITASLYDAHLQYCTDLIGQNRLTVFTPSEAVSYRMTANASKSATLTPVGTGYELTVTADNIDNRYKDEISVIVKLSAPCEKLDVVYKGTDPIVGNHPRVPPRKLSADGTAWSINVNPYCGTATLIPGADWTGPEVATAIAPQHVAAVSAVPVRIGVVQGTISAALPKGAYSLRLLNAAGRLVSTARGVSDGVASVTIAAQSCSAGFYLVNVECAAGVFSHRIVIE